MSANQQSEIVALNAVDPAKIAVIRITNPFNPRAFVRDELAWRPGLTVADCFPLVESNPSVVSVNGRVIEDEERASWALMPTDSVVVCPIPGGGSGGGGKSIFKLAAMIAISVYAGPLTQTIAGAAGIATEGMGMMLLKAGITLAGSMLLNALMPAPKPTQAQNAGLSDLNSSPTYGIDGAKNTASEGEVVPIPYGTFRYAGNLIDNYVENVGNTQYLYMLFNVGEGPIGGISDIKINEQPIANFTDVETKVRTGLPDQDLIDWFADTLTPRSVNMKLTTDFQMFNTIGEVDRLRFDFYAPQGLVETNASSGANSAVTVPLEVQYRKAGTDTWFSVGQLQIVSYVASYIYQDRTVDEFTGTVTVTETEYDSLQSGADFVQGDFIYRTDENGTYQIGRVKQTPVYDDLLRMSDMTRSTVRRSFLTPPLEQGMYETRFRRTTGDSTSDLIQDDIWISDINEIILDDVAYVNSALLALRIKLSDQLNGLPTVTHLNSGRVIRVWDETSQSFVASVSSNPAWITLDILTHKRYGGGMPDARIDLTTFKKWAKFCDEEGLTFNGVFDTGMNVWDAVRHVTRAGHAQLVNMGTRYTVVVEKPDTPGQMFSVANIVQDSFKQSWLPTADRANEIEVTYFDKEDDYKQRTIRIYDPAKLVSGITPKTAAITLFGVVDADRANKEGILQLNLNRYILQSVEFDASIEAISSTVGDLIFVQHDMPQWGYAGRLDAGSSVSDLVLDRAMTLEPGKTYKCLVLYDAITRVTGTIASVAGNTITLNGYAGQQNIKRFQANGKDVEVLDIFDSGGGFGIVVEDATPFAAGQAYSLIDTDVLVEREVQNLTVAPTDMTTIHVTENLPSAPAQFTHFMFGEATKVKKPFRIKMISGNGEYTRHLSCIEYNESVYNTDGYATSTPNYSDLNLEVENAVIDGVDELLTRIGSVVRTRVTVRFHSTQSNYQDSIVKVSRNGGPFIYVGREYDRASIEADDNEELIFKVIATNNLGRQVPESGAPTISYTVIGKTAKPADVQNVLINDKVLRWDKVDVEDLAGYSVRYQPGVNFSWGDAVPMHEGLLTEAPYDLSTFGVLAGQTTIMIKAVDTGGRESENPGFVITDFGDPIIENIVETFDEKAGGFAGTKTGGTVSGGNLVADATTGMWDSNSATKMWTVDTADMWHATVYNEMIYQFVITPTLAGAGSNMTLEYTIAGDSYAIYYRKQSTTPMWTIDANAMWNADSGTPMWQPDGATDFVPWPGQIPVQNEPYEFKITVAQGPTQGVISLLKAIIDMPDIVERLNDIVISAAGTRLPITETYRAILNVNMTLQSDGNGGIGVRILDKNNTLGPLVKVYDKTDTAVIGKLDATIQGY